MTNRRTKSPTVRLGDLLSRRGAWVLLVIVVVGLLAFGSSHPAKSSNAARAEYLDSIIKCPACNNISIAQSDIVQAKELRAKVAALIAAGESNDAIENYVVEHFGSNEILSPRRSGLTGLVWIIPLIVIGGGILLLAGFLWRRRTPEIARIHAADEALVAEARRAAEAKR